MKIDVNWMTARKTQRLSFRDPESWVLDFDGGGSIAVDCPWRILKNGQITVSSEDHKQQYGLPKRIDAASVANDLIGAIGITDIQVHEGTADLFISFGQDIQLQVLPFSTGYMKVGKSLIQMAIAS